MDNKSKVNDLINKVNTDALMSSSLSDWRPVLIDEVCVYVFGENYLAKRFDSINYKTSWTGRKQQIILRKTIET